MGGFRADFPLNAAETAWQTDARAARMRPKGPDKRVVNEVPQ